MCRYQVEHFDHNKQKDTEHDSSDILKFESYYDTLYGTRIYRFLDNDYCNAVFTALYMNSYIEESDLKKMILDDVISWKLEDPYDFKDLFISDKDDMFVRNRKLSLFPRETDKVEHNYPVCGYPYEKCPICGGELDGSVEEIESAEDIFNSRGGYGYEGEEWGEWDEIHRCPHCEKLFCVEVST